MSEKTYFDFAATTPVDERVVEAMLPYFNEKFGNPSSVHLYGQRAEYAVETAREIVADYINAEPEEIIFTSCGSESNNLALRGVALARRHHANGTNTIITSKVEHHAVSKTAEQLRQFFGFGIDWLPVDDFGVVNPRTLKNKLNSSVALVSLMYANNEIGSINDIQTMAELCAKNNIPFHTDAVQAAGYLPLDVKKTPVDLVSLGAHKLYGPKGVGALFVRNGTKILPTITGGGQENGLRAGTHNVPYIVGFAKAIELLKAERQARIEHVEPLRNHIIEGVLEKISGSKLTGHPENRLPQHASFVFKNVDGNLLLSMLDEKGFACSSGSACKTGNPEPSEVLTEIGLDREWSLGSLRITLGTTTTKDQVDHFLAILPNIIDLNRSLTAKR